MSPSKVQLKEFIESKPSFMTKEEYRKSMVEEKKKSIDDQERKKKLYLMHKKEILNGMRDSLNNLKKKCLKNKMFKRRWIETMMMANVFKKTKSNIEERKRQKK